MTLHGTASPLVLLAAAAAQAAPQQVAPQQVAPEQLAPLELVPVDQRVADVNPLGTSLRNVQNGLYQPGDFAQVFEVPGLEGAFMRVQGGVYAVFERSRYVESGVGLQALISANTVFYLGAPPAPFGAEDAAPPPAPNLIDGRLGPNVTGDSLRVTSRLSGRDEDRVDFQDEQRPVRATVAPGAPTIAPALRRDSVFGDLEYRAERLRALLRRATGSRQGPTAAHAQAARGLPPPSSSK